MIYCDSPTLEEWLAPPQPPLPQPTWTKLIVDGVMLSNSIEYGSWRRNPVCPIVCEACWSADCAMTGLARLVTLRDWILWLPGQAEDLDESWRDQLDRSHFLAQAVIMPQATWDGLHARFPNLPPADHYPPASRRGVAQLWLSEMPEAVRVRGLAELDDHLRRTALASDPLDLDPAREVIRSMIGWLNEAPGQSATGRIVRVQDAGGPANSFYFDGPPFPEWPAFIVGRDNSFVFDRGWVLLIGEADGPPDQQPLPAGTESRTVTPSAKAVRRAARPAPRRGPGR